MEIALKLTRTYELCLNALNGAFHSYLNDSRAMTHKSLVAFRDRANAIARQSYIDVKSAIHESTIQIKTEAVLRAHSDANKTATTINVIADTNEIDKLIKQIFVITVLDGVSLAKSLKQQYGMLVASGVTPYSAQIRVRERNRDKIVRTYQVDKAGHHVRSNWAFYLRLTSFLTNAAHNEYLKTAANLGFTTFKLSQPGHRRDGLRFSLDNIPEKELHPQSRAKICLIKEAP